MIRFILKKLALSALLLILGWCMEVTGAWTNFKVMAANLGAMPVWNIDHRFDGLFMFDPSHCELTYYSRYKILSDIIPEPVFTFSGKPIFAMMSIGDVMFESGDFCVLLSMALFLATPFWAVIKKRRYAIKRERDRLEFLRAVNFSKYDSEETYDIDKL